MKNVLMLAAAAAVALTPLAASAQSYHYERGEHGGGWQRDYHPGRYEDHRYDGRDNSYHARWERGQRLPSDYRSRYILNDYGHYGYRAPPRGYAYYRDDRGNVFMALVATGIIASIIASESSYDHGPVGYDVYGNPIY